MTESHDPGAGWIDAVEPGRGVPGTSGEGLKIDRPVDLFEL